MNRRQTGAALLLAGLLLAGGAGSSAWAERLDDALFDYRRGDYAEAAQVFERLARQGDTSAQFWLGTMWYQGRGKPRNYKEAYQWYRRAAFGGNAEAQNNLGVIFRDGEGQERNPVVAYAWFSLAASGGNEVATRNRDELAGAVSADQVLQGQQLTTEYLALIESERRHQAARLAAAGPLPGFPPPGSPPPPPPPPGFPPPGSPPPPPPPPGFPPPGSPPPPPGVPPGAGDSGPLSLAPLSPVTVPPPAQAGLPPPPPPPSGTAPWGRPAGVGQPPPPPPGGAPGRLLPGEAPEVYLVQLGLFQSPDGIRTIRRTLREQQLTASEAEVEIRGQRYQRFRLGPFARIEDAQSLSHRVDQMFHLQSAVIPLPR